MFFLHNGNWDSEEGNGLLFRSPDHSYIYSDNSYVDEGAYSFIFIFWKKFNSFSIIFSSNYYFRECFILWWKRN